ncbi:PQQ-like domain protein [Calidithermus terrae]|uniref:PQQ-like domain protein n=1 Tax=Calidithermus terrae TaxID=1408545 RepID=A0A399ECV9_9DEIN|nr:PQQ-like domain protein [Calidithermus terrae]
MVKVIGMDQSERTVTADTDLKVPPGTYVVSGLAVGGGEKDAPVYAPSVTSQEVTVGSGAGAAVKVEYGLLQTKISPETRVADDAASASLTSLVQGSDGRTTLTFSGGNPQITALKAGEILVLGPSSAAPEGHFGRVVSNDGTTVVTEPAAMQDVIQRGAFVFSKTIDLSAPGVVLPQGIRRLDEFEQCLAVDKTLAASGSGGSAAVGLTVRVSGTLCLSSEITLTTSFNVDKNLKPLPPDVNFNAKFKTGDKTNLKVTASANVTTPAGAAPFDFPALEVALLPISLGTYTVWTGPVPWVITPNIRVYVGAGGTVTAGVQFGFKADVEAGGGFFYDGKANRFTPKSTRTQTFIPDWPPLTSTLDLRAYISPSLELIINGLAGPFLRLDPYLRFKANIGSTVDWKLLAGLDLSTGITPLLGIALGYSTLLYNYEEQILSSSNTPNPGQTTTSAPGFAASGGMVVGPDDTVYVGSGNSVRAFANALVPKWTYNTSSSVLGVSRGDDGTIYAWDFGGTLYAINPDGTEKWKTDPLGNLEIRRVALTANGLVVTAGGNTVRTFSAANGAPGWSDDVGESVYSVVVDKSGNIWSNGSSSVRKHAPTGGVLATVAAPSSPGGMAMAPDGTIYVRTISNGVIQVSAVSPNATLKWSKSLSNTNNERAEADSLSEPAVGPDGTIYICGTPTDPKYTGSLFAVSPTAPTASLEVPKWIYTHFELCEATPAVGNNGQVYIVTNKTLRAVNASDGKLAWSVAAGNNDTESSPVFLTNKSVVAGTSSGLISVHAGGQLATGTWAREGGDANSSRRMK